MSHLPNYNLLFPVCLFSPPIFSSLRPFPQVLLLSERRGEEGRQHVVRVQHGPRRQHGQGEWRVLCGMCCVVCALRVGLRVLVVHG